MKGDQARELAAALLEAAAEFDRWVAEAPPRRYAVLS
jgi:hypothetical protein